MADPDDHKYELEDVANVPGTYFNPQTEVVVIVDDSVSIGQDVFNLEDFEGSDWVRISEEVPVDESALDEAVEAFGTRYQGGGSSAGALDLDLDDDDEEDDHDDEPEGFDPEDEEGEG